VKVFEKDKSSLKKFLYKNIASEVFLMQEVLHPSQENTRPRFSKSHKYICVCLKAIFSLIYLSYQGLAMAQIGMRDEIISTTSPTRFEPLNITSKIARHIPMGTKRQEAVSILAAQGFEIKEVAGKISGCDNCDPIIVYAGYTNKSLIPLAPYKSFVSIRLGFKNDLLTKISAWHTRNAY